ncbi:MAG: hypothetical protein R6X14_08720 [bacterium]
MSEDKPKQPAGHEELVLECSECAELMELITEYLDDRETVEMRRALMEHAAACDHCARLLWTMRRVVATCRAETGSAVPVEVHAALWQVLVEEFRAGRGPEVEEPDEPGR